MSDILTRKPWNDGRDGDWINEAAAEIERLTLELAEAREAARNAAAVIGAVYQWVERVEAAGGAKSLPGVAACHAVLTSLRKMRAVLARLDAEEPK